MSERLSNNKLIVPRNISEQLQYMPDTTLRVKICEQLYKGLSFYLESFDVRLDPFKGGFRTKSVERINEKITRRGSYVALRDIYGIRLITEDNRRDWIKDLIQAAYPLTPKVFPDGKPSAREYADPVVREFFREKHNPHTSPLYSAMHINIAFERYGSPYLDIAEVQLMNANELLIYNETRDHYINGQALDSRNFLPKP